MCQYFSFLIDLENTTLWFYANSKMMRKRYVCSCMQPEQLSLRGPTRCFKADLNFRLRSFSLISQSRRYLNSTDPAKMRLWGLLNLTDMCVSCETNGARKCEEEEQQHSIGSLIDNWSPDAHFPPLQGLEREDGWWGGHGVRRNGRGGSG